jgi:uncharacterized surface protein with fasciclin (FAS1) repeats
MLDAIAARPELTRVLELVELAGLEGQLTDAEPETFLAPSNEAIDAFEASAEGGATLADPDLLRQLLLRHLVPDALDATSIFSTDRLDTVAGDTLVVDSASRTVDGADLLVTDIAAENGFVHIVSDVLSGAPAGDGVD